MTAVKVTFKQTGTVGYFKSYAELCKKHSPKDIGITLQALWNALSPVKGKDKYENAKCVIERTSFKNWQ